MSEVEASAVPSPCAVLKATDLAATMAWYQAVGFAVRGSFPEEGEATWCEVARDDLALQFIAGETPWDGPPSCTGTVYVRPPSVAAVAEAIAGKVEVPWGVEERPWGARELTLRDPDGYFVTFTEPLA